jgi:tRNA(Ile)-lysidine synthase
MRAPDTLVRQVQRFLDREGIEPGGMIVAVSGGPDSVALLRALGQLRCGLAAPGRDLSLGPLVIAHFNHQLRGSESDADEAFVAALSTQLANEGVAGLLYRCGRADVAARAREEGGNLESIARRLRYAWLADLAHAVGVPWVVTGHTADDQAETVLHRLLRGTGLKGLSGIAARRRLAAEVEVLRPLLAVTRTQILAYLEAAGQAYRVDSSNADRSYTRNRIRQELLPYLTERYNPALVGVLCRLAMQAAEASRNDELRAAALVTEAEQPRAGPLVILDRERLAAAPRHEVREALRFIWAREGWPMGSMDYDAWDRLAAVVFGEAVAVDLPGGIRAHGQARVVQIGRRS